MNPPSNTDQPHQHATCPACAGRAVDVGYHLANHNQVRYTRWHCPGCDLEFWTPLLVDTSIYDDTGFAAYQDYHAGRRPFPRWAKPLFSSLSARNLRALDIGCGDGAVLARLQQLGVEVRGIDLDPKSILIAEKRCGVGTCSVTTLDEFIASRSEHDPAFGLVSFFEVLEHQTDPAGFLAQVRSLVAPGGSIAGSVPARDRFLASFDRRVDSGDLPPHHFLWFSDRSLRRMLESAGFTDVAVSRTGRLSLGETHAKARELLRRKLTALKPLPTVLSIAASTLLAIPLAVAYWAGRSLRPSHLFFQGRPCQP